MENDHQSTFGAANVALCECMNHLYQHPNRSMELHRYRRQNPGVSANIKSHDRSKVQFPVWLPSPEQTLEWLIEENLSHPENLPIHDLDVSQRFIAAETNWDNLYKIDISPLQTTVGMIRDHKTGELRGYTEEFIDGCNDGTRLDMNREPLPSIDIRGKNIPFWPGGFDEHYALDVPLISDEALLDFYNDLLTVPPNFKRGLEFSHDPSIIDQSEMSQVNRVINLTDILQMDDNIWMPVEKISDASAEISIADNTVQISAEDAHDVTDALESSIPVTPVSSSTSVAKDTEQEEWVVMVNSNRPVKYFHTRVPHMAHNWPFELDPFQNQAIVHLENNQNVFVAAHTSAGKTVVAEYAIALSLNHLTRTIYTSPIKALSNQKFRDFRQTFGDSNVGLVTGDVQLNTTASCLIMTTEILRSMLYHGSEVIRDLEWVIFDEVHYINDTERGVVWEEVLIMLPSHVNIVLLSATVPNTREFAAWVGKTKKKKIYVVSTLKRPVPLEHYLYTGNSDKTSKELFLVVDFQGQFLTRGYDKALAAKKERETKSASSFGARGPREGFTQQDRSTWLSLIKMLERTDRLPAVAFIFSKKKIDDNATNLSSVDLTTNKEKSAIHSFIHTSVSRLTPLDRLLPQVTKMEDLLKRGMGVHHSGVLPILKEVVELLFQRGLVKILFATETFAMGVNMPARTVLFDTTKKHDGTQLRPLYTGEYIQMAGRAGRRGIDTTGTVIIMCKGDVIKSSSLHNMILGKPTKLESRFRLTYSMILNLCRVEQLRMEDMLKRSFTEFHAQSDHSKHRVNIEHLRDEMDALVDIECLQCAVDLEECYQESRTYGDIRNCVQKTIMSHPAVSHKLTSGRLIQVQSDAHTDLLAVILTVWKCQGHESPIYTVLALCDQHEYQNLNVDELPEVSYNSDTLPIVNRTLFRSEGVPFYKIFTCDRSHITVITTKLLKIEAEMILNDVKKRQQLRFRDHLPIAQVTIVTQDMSRFLDGNPKSLPSIDPVKDLKLRDIDLVEQIRSLAMVERKFINYSCLTCPLFDKHFAEIHKHEVLKSKYNKLKFLLSDDSLSLLPEYINRVKVLKELQFLNAQGQIQLKGRVACELSSATLLTSQIIFLNVLEHLMPADIAALLSCVVFQDRRYNKQKLPDSLIQAQLQIEEIADELCAVQKNCDVRFDGDDYDLQINFGLMQVVYEWALGTPFKDITELTDIQEGVIVRTIQRLHEVLRDVKDAARIIGNPGLYNKMEQAATLIKRDIVFAASLYTQ